VGCRSQGIGELTIVGPSLACATGDSPDVDEPTAVNQSRHFGYRRLAVGFIACAPHDGPRTHGNRHEDDHRDSADDSQMGGISLSLGRAFADLS
jgi:hypothetical protein